MLRLGDWMYLRCEMVGVVGVGGVVVEAVACLDAESELVEVVDEH